MAVSAGSVCAENEEPVCASDSDNDVGTASGGAPLPNHQIFGEASILT